MEGWRQASRAGVSQAAGSERTQRGEGRWHDRHEHECRQRAHDERERQLHRQGARSRFGLATSSFSNVVGQLLERQGEVLRERNRQLERKVKDFVDVARENDALGARVLSMARRLIAAPDGAAVIGAIEAALREDFDAAQSVLVLTPAQRGLKRVGPFTPQVPYSGRRWGFIS